MAGHLFGTHIGPAELLIPMINDVKELGGTCVQIFVKDLKQTDIAPVKKALGDAGLSLFVHSSYEINLARDWSEYSHWIKSLEREIYLAYSLGAIGIIIHFGKQMDKSLVEAYNNMYTSLIYVHSQTKKYKIKILLETPAGQGSEICFKLNDLAYFFKKFSKSISPEVQSRFQICLDTCHIFSSGYDIRTKDKIKMYLDEFDELIGLNHLGLVHLNDSKVDLGERVDRHAGIGHGFIGKEPLLLFFKYFKKLGKPIILETHFDNYKTEIPFFKTLSPK